MRSARKVRLITGDFDLGDKAIPVRKGPPKSKLVPVNQHRAAVAKLTHVSVAKLKKANAPKSPKKKSQPQNLSREVVQRLVLVSRKVWERSGQLRPEASRITGVQATVSQRGGQWAWSLNTGSVTGVAGSLEEARTAALHAVLRERPCLAALARLAGFRLSVGP